MSKSRVIFGIGMGCLGVGIPIGLGAAFYHGGVADGVVQGRRDVYLQYAQKATVTPLESAIGLTTAYLPSGKETVRVGYPKWARFLVGGEPMQMSYDLLKELNAESIDSIVDVLDQKANAKVPVTVYSTQLKGTTYLVKVEADGKAYGLKN